MARGTSLQLAKLDVMNLSDIKLESCEYCYSPPNTFIDITTRNTPAVAQHPFLIHEGIEKVSKLFLACLPSSAPQFSYFFPNHHTYIPHTMRSVETEICGIYCLYPHFSVLIFRQLLLASALIPLLFLFSLECLDSWFLLLAFFALILLFFDLLHLICI